MVTNGVTEAVESKVVWRPGSEMGRFYSAYTRFGDRLRSLRLRNGISAVDLSFELRLTRDHLADLEIGREAVDLHLLSAIASHFHMSVAELISGV